MALLNKGDAVSRFLCSGKFDKTIKVDRVTKTQAVLTNGVRLRRLYISGCNLTIIGKHNSLWSSPYYIAEKEKDNERH